MRSVRILAVSLAIIALAACSSQPAGAQPGQSYRFVDAGPTATPEPVEPDTPGAITAPKLPSTYAALTTRTWALLAKNPDGYTGKGYKVWACISQFDAATGPTVFRAEASWASSAAWYVTTTNALFVGKEATLEAFVKGDVVALSAVSMGSFDYDTQIGGSTTVPLFWVAKIKRIGSC